MNKHGRKVGKTASTNSGRKSCGKKHGYSLSHVDYGKKRNTSKSKMRGGGRAGDVMGESGKCWIRPVLPNLWITVVVPNVKLDTENVTA